MILKLLIPFIGTTLGSACVFLVRKEKLDERIEKAFLGFAGGVMVAASFFSLLLPSLDSGDITMAVIGLLSGMGFLLLMDSLLPHLHLHTDEPEGLKTKKRLSKVFMMFMAVTLHNVPEGAAAGIAMVSGTDIISESASLALLIGIAIQNFPEGAIVALPLRTNGMSRFKAFLYGTATGAVEPVAALLMFAIAPMITPFMPLALSFAAGAMLYVVIEELIPEASVGKHSNIATVAFALGLALMMVLDVTLS